MQFSWQVFVDEKLPSILWPIDNDLKGDFGFLLQFKVVEQFEWFFSTFQGFQSDKIQWEGKCCDEFAWEKNIFIQDCTRENIFFL